MRLSRVSEDTIWSLIAQFGDRSRRKDVVARIVAATGAERLILFTRDPELGLLLPAPGFPQTLSRAWMEIVRLAELEHSAVGELVLEGRTWHAQVFARGEGALVLLGGEAVPEHVERLLEALPLLSALLQNELVAQRAEENSMLASRAAAEADSLSRHLDQVRRELQISWRELSEAKAAAETASRFKSDFLANMSHEIRTPMAAILGYVDVLQRQVQDPESLEYLQIIGRNGVHLLEIINDILDLSKIEAGSLAVEMLDVSISSLLAEVRSLMEVRLAERELHLDLVFDGPIPATIQSDPTRIRQILTNLVGNAIKFTRHGGVKVKVRLLPEAELLELSVRDTGIGIGSDVLPSLFQAFQQGDASITRRFGGTGLGLAISRRLVELLGGTIEASSVLGEGSLFTFTVATGPLQEVPLIEAAAVDVGAPIYTSPLPSLRGSRVLVIDDQKDIRELVSRHLQAAGAIVTTGNDGQSALRLLGQSSVDVMVLDMQMPTMDGYTTAWGVRQAGHALPILALTASAMKGDREVCLEAGCTGYLTKPVAAIILVSKVWTLLRCHRKLRVLVVEDNVFAGKAVAAMIESLGCDCAIALSGQAALLEATQRLPDVVLVDMGLPDMDGWTLLAKLRGIDGLCTSRLVALTGRRGEEMGSPDPDLVFDQVLEKPASRDTLGRTLFP